MHMTGITLLELDCVDSTNTYAKDRFDDLADGTLVCADMQTAGRGRLGRPWLSPAGTNIYASLVIKRFSDPFYATAAVSLAAMILLLENHPAGDFFIKWPNDLYAGYRKIAGLLSETVSGRSGIRGVITGIGININLEPAELEKIDQPAASLKSLSGRTFDIGKLKNALVQHLAESYQWYQTDPDAMIARWKSYNRIVGREVTLTDPAGTEHHVRVREIAPDGGLVAEENGAEYHFSCGDVTLRREDWL